MLKMTLSWVELRLPCPGTAGLVTGLGVGGTNLGVLWISAVTVDGK